MRPLEGELVGYDPDHPEWLAMDLRLTADNADSAAGFKTATGQMLRIAAHQFDGLGNDMSVDQARDHWRGIYGAAHAALRSNTEEQRND